MFGKTFAEYNYGTCLYEGKHFNTAPEYAKEKERFYKDFVEFRHVHLLWQKEWPKKVFPTFFTNISKKVCQMFIDTMYSKCFINITFHKGLSMYVRHDNVLWKEEHLLILTFFDIARKV